MPSWREVELAAPELSADAKRRFDAHKHLTLATLRRDGSPRISGTEVTFRNGEMWLGGMPGSLKCLDLRRDPRFALHSGSDEPDSWLGDAKVAGRAIEVVDPTEIAAYRDDTAPPPGPFHLFRLDLTELVFVRVGTPVDHLVIESWHEGRGVERVERR